MQVGVYRVGFGGRALGCFALFFLVFAGAATVLGELSWQSVVAGGGVIYRVLLEPKDGQGVTIVVLSRLADTRASEEARGRSRESFASAGYRVIEIDYAGVENARFPHIAQDIVKLRNDVLRHGLFGGLVIDPDRIFILPEGFLLETDVCYFEDERRPLYMDIAYPAFADNVVPCVLEFSCDNVRRMGNYSLAVCRDGLLESFAVAGYAFAMADHPVAPPYKGIDPMPESGERVNAAIRTARGKGRELGLSGEIGVVGFSRGSGMALLAATTMGMDRFEGVGGYQDEESSVQAAIVLSGRFTYMNLLPDDKMRARYETVWGERESNLLRWKEQGALDYLEGATIPLFLGINSGEGADAQWQMRVLRERLEGLGSEVTFVLDDDGAGHTVPVDAVILEGMRKYLRARFR